MNLENNPKMGYDKELEVSSIGWRDIWMDHFLQCPYGCLKKPLRTQALGGPIYSLERFDDP
jgi:hypothetical protein